MQLKDVLNTVEGLDALIKRLPLSGGRVVDFLLNSCFLTQKDAIERIYDQIQAVQKLMDKAASRIPWLHLSHQFSRVKDIRRTLENLSLAFTLDEIQLFEIKQYVFTLGGISELLQKLGFDLIPLPELREVREILDPDSNGIAAFYLYDSYSPALSAARKRLQQLKAKEIDSPQEQEALTAAYSRMEEASKAVLRMLSEKLQPHAAELMQSFEQVARIEILFAKAVWAREAGFCRPSFASELEIRGMFHPIMAERLREENKTWQAVDIRLEPGPCLMTGANMSGKTVILKTLSLIQHLAQFGFFVPARTAVLPVFNRIMFSIGDRQDDMRGLSSYAAEILEINDIILTGDKDPDILVLIDEPAKTTNPSEGKALVNALLARFSRNRIMALISTHYSGLDTSRCRCLRVKGFEKPRDGAPLKPENIRDYIDYSLVEDNRDHVPMEALRIAGLLGVDPDFIASAGDYLNKQSNGV